MSEGLVWCGWCHTMRLPHTHNVEGYRERPHLHGCATATGGACDCSCLCVWNLAHTKIIEWNPNCTYHNKDIVTVPELPTGPLTPELEAEARRRLEAVGLEYGGILYENLNGDKDQ